jgi:hypothetical protein
VSDRFRPVTASALAGLVADVVSDRALDHPTRVAVDGPSAAQPAEFARRVAEVLRGRGRAASVIAAETFWRDASLRLEWGRTDVESYARDWLDDGALDREVLGPLGPGGRGEFLPALRDPATNRSARVPYQPAAPDEVVIVAGELLLGRGLAFDVTVHLALAAGARARRTDPDWAWTLPAHDRYDREVDPMSRADVVIRWNDPQHPAVRIASGFGEPVFEQVPGDGDAAR